MKKLWVVILLPVWLPLFCIGWLAGAAWWFIGGGYLVAMQMDWEIKDWKPSTKSGDGK